MSTFYTTNYDLARYIDNYKAADAEHTAVLADRGNSYYYSRVESVDKRKDALHNDICREIAKDRQERQDNLDCQKRIAAALEIQNNTSANRKIAKISEQIKETQEKYDKWFKYESQFLDDLAKKKEALARYSGEISELQKTLGELSDLEDRERTETLDTQKRISTAIENQNKLLFTLLTELVAKVTPTN